LIRHISLVAVLSLASACVPRAFGPPNRAGDAPAPHERERAHRTHIAAALQPLRAEQPSFDQTTAGRVVVVDVWATWCDACRETIPQVRHLAETYTSDRLVVVGINVGEAHEVVTRYAADAQMHYPLYLDPEFAFADAVGASEVPAILVIARDGSIVHRGSKFDRVLLERIERELATDIPEAPVKTQAPAQTLPAAVTQAPLVPTARDAKQFGISHPATTR